MKNILLLLHIVLLSTFSFASSQIRSGSVCNTPAPTGEEVQSPCNKFKEPTVSDLEIIGNNIKWYDVENNGTVLSSTDKLKSGATYYASQTINDCESITRFAVKITYSPPSPPALTRFFCSGDNPTISDLGENMTWYESNKKDAVISPETPLVSAMTYYGENIELCVKISQPVYIVETSEAPTGETIQSFCGSATIADIKVIGSDINWYTSSKGGNPISIATELEYGTTYYASQSAEHPDDEISVECQRLAITVVEECLSIEDHNLATPIEIYPNPIQDKLNINTSEEIQSVQIYTLQGQSVLNSTESVIDTSTLLEGIYVIIIKTKESTFSQKIIKE